MNAAKLKTVQEIIVGEDRVFQIENGTWWYQLRGSSEAHGPHKTAQAAKDAWANIYNEQGE